MAGSLVKQLGQWMSAIFDNPYMCGPELWQDILALQDCFDNYQDVCFVSMSVVFVVAAIVLTVMSLLIVCAHRLCRMYLQRKKKGVLFTPLSSDKLKLFHQKEVEEIQKRKKEKMRQEWNLKRVTVTVADELLDIYSEGAVSYNRDTPLPDMGSRLEKYWYRVTSQESYNSHILTIGSISDSFTCDHGVEEYINKRLSDLHHPYVQTINEIKFLTSKNKQVAVIQPCWEIGSLKDYIYKVSPFQEWSLKYSKVTDGLPPSKVALFGGQILEAMIYLYGRGLTPLGHVQTGNVYMESEDLCRLGGYENTLLMNKARLHRTCATFGCMEDIDVIMFGHVVYEMSTGRELSRLVPMDLDYSSVEDAGCKEVLQYIFGRREDGRFKRGIIKIQSHWFFGGIESDVMEMMELQPHRQSKAKTAAAFLTKTRQLLKH